MFAKTADEEVDIKTGKKIFSANLQTQDPHYSQTMTHDLNDRTDLILKTKSLVSFFAYMGENLLKNDVTKSSRVILTFRLLNPRRQCTGKQLDATIPFIMFNRAVSGLSGTHLKKI
jgi:hypothetical protein